MKKWTALLPNVNLKTNKKVTDIIKVDGEVLTSRLFRYGMGYERKRELE